MRMLKIVVPASLALIVGAGAAALAPQPAKPAGAAVARLQPLGDEDMTSTREMGCSCAFESGNRTLVQAIGNELMVRTQAGRKVCPISDAQFHRIAGGSGAYSCGGVKMSLRRTGKVTSYVESDSAISPASLTLGEGSSRRSVSGTWGCAC